MQEMKLDLGEARVVAVRTNKTVYRLGDYAIKVFDNDFSNRIRYSQDSGSN